MTCSLVKKNKGIEKAAQLRAPKADRLKACMLGGKLIYYRYL
jgi:hypothetical protein